MLDERSVNVNSDNIWFNDDCTRAFDLKQVAYLRWTRHRSRVNYGEFVDYQKTYNVLDAEAGSQFMVTNSDVLMNAQCPHEYCLP